MAQRSESGNTTMQVIMKTVHFLILVLLATRPAWGNSTKVDSLKQLLERHTTTDKAEVLWGIAYELFDVDNAQALFYAERAYHDVWKGGDSLQIVKVGTTYGQLLRRMGKLQKSIEVSTHMMPIAKRHAYTKYWKMLLNSLASTYSYLEEYPLALEKIYELLNEAEETNDLDGKVIALHNIGFLMFKLGDFDRSISYSLESIRLAERNSDDVAVTLLTIAAAHMGRGDYDSALHYSSKAFLIHKQENVGNVMAVYYQHFALSYFGLKRYDSARYFSQLAIDSSIAEGRPWSQISCYIMLSQIALLKSDVGEAKVYIERASYALKQVDFPSLKLDLLKQEARYQATIGNSDSTMKLIDLQYQLQDSIYNGRKAAAIRNVQVRFDEREIRKKISLQSNILRMQEENLGQQRMLIFIVSIFLLIVTILSLALYRALRKLRLINTKLDQKVMDRTNELSKHRDVLQHLIDEEKSRRARATAEMAGLVKSLKGLLHLAKLDPKGKEEDYLDKAMTVALQMDTLNLKYGAAAHRTPADPLKEF